MKTYDVVRQITSFFFAFTRNTDDDNSNNRKHKKKNNHRTTPPDTGRMKCGTKKQQFNNTTISML